MEKVIEKEHDYIPDQEDIWQALGYVRHDTEAARREMQAAKHKFLDKPGHERSPPSEPWDDY